MKIVQNPLTNKRIGIRLVSSHKTKLKVFTNIDGSLNKHKNHQRSLVWILRMFR